MTEKDIDEIFGEDPLEQLFQYFRELGIDADDIFDETKDKDMIIDFRVMERAQKAYRIMKEQAIGSGAKVDFLIEYQYRTGVVRISGKDFSFDPTGLFIEAFKLADEMDISPFLNGTLEVNLYFYHLTVPLKDEKR